VIERDGLWVISNLPQRPEEKKEPAKDQPMRKVTTKSFLWGMYTITTEQ